jgi:CRP-like cAMP-binding protein
MEVRTGEATEVRAALREAAPFRDLSEGLLERIAALAKPVRLAAGERVYAAGEVAGDVYVVASGRIEHVFKREFGAREALKRIGPGGVLHLLAELGEVGRQDRWGNDDVTGHCRQPRLAVQAPPFRPHSA